ncbi:type II toxin-antitoxin system YafQ family toxin, partial [Mannheimia haemolytica]
MMESKPLKVSYSKQFVRDLTDLAKRHP